MSHYSIRSLIFVLLAYSIPLGAQFAQPYFISGPGNETGRQLLALPGGDLLVGGAFTDELILGDKELPRYGQTDCFIGRLTLGGAWSWAFSIGSSLDDNLQIMEHLSDGGILLAGTYWLTLTYQGNTLTTSGNNAKGIFILALDEAGKWRWGKTISGSGLKDISDALICPQGNIYLTGHFSDKLEVGPDILRATGREDAYLVSLDSQGNWMGASQYGYRGQTQGRALAWHPDGDLYWSGTYEDTLLLAGDTLLANTFDQDVFLSRISTLGELRWARRAGGVFEDQVIAMTTSEQGNLLMTGHLTGVMTLSESISIQSRNGDPDIFIAGYSEDGEVLWARSIGSEEIDLPKTIVYRTGQVIIGGLHYQQLEWDGLTTPPITGVGGFIASFDPADGRSQWLYGIGSDFFAGVVAMALDEAGQVHVLADFTGSLSLGGQHFEPIEHYDIALVTLSEQATPVVAPPKAAPLKIFPNPAREIIHINGGGISVKELRIYDAAGRRVHVNEGVSADDLTISLAHLVPGIYTLVTRTAGAYRIVIQR